MESPPAPSTASAIPALSDGRRVSRADQSQMLVQYEAYRHGRHERAVPPFVAERRQEVGRSEPLRELCRDAAADVHPAARQECERDIARHGAVASDEKIQR